MGLPEVIHDLWEGLVGLPEIIHDLWVDLVGQPEVIHNLWVGLMGPVVFPQYVLQNILKRSTQQ